MSEEIKPETFKKPLPKSITASLPAYLKDPANYYKIQKAILEAGATRHSHGEIGEWAKCKQCQQKEWNRKEMMLKLGFKSGAQYLQWKKIMNKIDERYPLVDWGKSKITT